MVQITLEIAKTLEQNAAQYYEKAKKLKHKQEGAIQIIKEAKGKLARLEKEISKDQKQENDALASVVPQQKKEWYEKFRWFFSSTGFLVVGGRDATTNEILLKKHTGQDDIVFHTDMAGSPFFVIKAEGKKIDDEAILEAASATASFSKAWKLGMANTPVFWVKPEQVTKQAKAGEFLTKGAFMIYGKKNYIENAVGCTIGDYHGKIMAGPSSAINKHCPKVVEIEQGGEKASDVAKRVQHKIGGSLDDIIRCFPSGGCKVKNPPR